MRVSASSLEESSPAFGLADLISTRWSTVNRLRLLLITNRVLSARVDGREAGEFQGKPVTYSVWDLGRCHRYALSGREREEIVVGYGAVWRSAGAVACSCSNPHSMRRI